MFSNILCWLWPLISGVICAILGYLLGRIYTSSKWKNKYSHLEDKYDNCKKSKKELAKEDNNSENDISDLKSKLASLTIINDNLKTENNKLKDSSSKPNQKLGFAGSTIDNSKFESEISNLKSELASLTAKNKELSTKLEKFNNPFDAETAKAVFGKKIKQDDLKVIEGIGPKIEELFHANGIKTWKALSEASLEKCNEVLRIGGDRFKIHNPGTWPKQAELAYLGKWAELLKWQDELDGGK